MRVDLIDCMGDDLTVVNAARVSFHKESDYEIEGDFENDDWKFKLRPEDEKLIYYLARHQHWTPFAHPQITLRMKAPIFIRTQCFKHKQGFVENEVSRRDVDDEPTFFLPDHWRGRPTNSKQGSSEEVINLDPNALAAWPLELMNKCKETYLWMIKQGVAPEQARMVLPQSMYTEWYWTGSLAAYARFYKQRIDPHAQKEIQDLAKMVGDIIQPIAPVSWKALTE